MRAALALALLLLAPLAASAQETALSPFVRDATHADAATIPPRDVSLLDLAVLADARFGIVRAPGAYDALRTLDPAIGDVTADLLHALLWAAEERDAAYADVSDAEIAAALASESGDPSILARIDTDRVRAAATALAIAVDEATPRLREIAQKAPQAPKAQLAPPTIDLFPILGIDPIGVANVFPHDYFLSIDLGGDDVYDNNAGGSIIQRGQSVGEPGTWGPTVPVPDTIVVDQDGPTGRIFLDPGGDIIVGGEFEEGEAAHSASLAIDVAGNDVYGVYKAPSAAGIDRQCTTDPVVRRVIIQGSGGAGIGILADLAGDDAYRGKTLAQGSGHVAGVGILFDAAGSDSYTSVRSALGIGLLGGVGVLVDPEGDDVYDMRAPAGGIKNQPDDTCDASTRIALGVGTLHGEGFVYEGGGQDRYRVGAVALGHADAQSHGVFLDAAGDDDYGGFPGRNDGRELIGTPGGGLAYFRDV